MRVATVASLGSCRGSSLDSDPAWVGLEDQGGQMVSKAQNPSRGPLSLSFPVLPGGEQSEGE